MDDILVPVELMDWLSNVVKYLVWLEDRALESYDITSEYRATNLLADWDKMRARISTCKPDYDPDYG